MGDRNRELEAQLKEAKAEVEKMETSLKTKELQYQVLSKEYSELSEAVAVSFDKHYNDVSH